jgi:hypothetical protein
MRLWYHAIRTMLITKGRVNTVLQPSPAYWGQSPKRIYVLMSVTVAPVYLEGYRRLL